MKINAKLRGVALVSAPFMIMGICTGTGNPHGSRVRVLLGYTRAFHKRDTSRVHATTGTTTKHSPANTPPPPSSRSAALAAPPMPILPAPVLTPVSTSMDALSQQPPPPFTRSSMPAPPPPSLAAPFPQQQPPPSRTPPAAPTSCYQPPASSVCAQSTPANAGVARTHMEDTRTRKEGKEKEVRRKRGGTRGGRKDLVRCDARHVTLSRHHTTISHFDTLTFDFDCTRHTTCHDISIYFDVSVIHAVPPLLLVPSTYVQVTSAFTDVCWTYVLSTGGDTYGTHG
ncbi:uncharacterized protein F5147DRAFT_787403 [Suillus discolor]|uniref:Uncharacterized protein n=1 Tax=Suillus discolor TaxID=1912936 RepID=A0A9P7ETG8_9AGAM|nr:uncharacterized protein F5147DRAFT_787403 [Suillus discolor]KAG2090118.1 hypothetical protein F5147DRAFT_787403 [Suillus discolor]